MGGRAVVPGWGRLWGGRPIPRRRRAARALRRLSDTSSVSVPPPLPLLRSETYGRARPSSQLPCASGDERFPSRDTGATTPRGRNPSPSCTTSLPACASPLATAT